MTATDLGGADRTVCIPARELTGTREAGLAELHTFLAQLELARSNQRFFPGRLGSTDLRRRQNTALVGGAWWFGNKQGAW